MPSNNRCGRGSAQKRSRSRELTPERADHRRQRDRPLPKRRNLRSSFRDDRNGRSQREEFVDDRFAIPSTSRRGSNTRSNRGVKRKASIAECLDQEESKPQRKKQHVEKDKKKPKESRRSTKHDSKKKCTCATDGTEEEEDLNANKCKQKDDEKDAEKEGDREKTTEEKTKDEKKDECKADVSDTEEDKEKQEEEGKKEEDEVKSNGKEDNDDDDGQDGATAESQRGEKSSSGNASAEKPESRQDSSGGENTGRGKERQRSSCMGCCYSREEEEWQYHEHLRIPPKSANNGVVVPSGMLAGVGLSSWNELMPLPTHEEHDEWLAEMEPFVNPGCSSPPLPPQVNSNDLLDLERLLELYEIDMSQEYCTSITGNGDGM